MQGYWQLEQLVEVHPVQELPPASGLELPSDPLEKEAKADTTRFALD
jgi:hypothetical protein